MLAAIEAGGRSLAAGRRHRHRRAAAPAACSSSPFPNGSKIVVNTQPPLQELWLAAQSGGFHFRSVGGRWIDSRDGREFFDVLSALRQRAGRHGRCASSR